MENSTHNLIYRSVDGDELSRSFPLFTRSCEIKYYVPHELEATDILVGELLMENGGQLDSESLGLTLGFDIRLSPEEGAYYDEAEDNLYKKLIGDVKKWGIISVDKGMISLTPLGRICLQNRKKYSFFHAEADVLGFITLRSSDCEEIHCYPFRDELGLSLVLNHKTPLSYCDKMCDVIGVETDNVLVNDLQLQVDYGICVYYAKYTDYRGLKPFKLDVELYGTEGGYSLKFLSNGRYCPKLEEIFEFESNVGEKEKKVEQCLYCRLLNDPDAVLDFETLHPFEDLLEVGKLIVDSRLVWTDKKLVELIVPLCNADNWLSLSEHCDCEVLKTLIPKHVNDLDWGTLTLRLDSQYLSGHSREYPWNKRTLLARTPVEGELVRQFLTEYKFPNGRDDGEWEWDDVLQIVGMEFIFQHLGDIPFELSSITSDLDDVQKQYVVTNPTARWDWGFISEKYPIDFLVSNLSVLYPHMNMRRLVCRIFTDKEVAGKYSSSQSLREIIRLSELNQEFCANGYDFVWTQDVIKFLESCGLISWASSAHGGGFECNPYLVWNEEFFRKNSDNVTTPYGFSWVSHHITASNIVDMFPTFQWDGIALSQNPVVYNDSAFIIAHWDKLDVATIFEYCDITILGNLFKSLPENLSVSELLSMSQHIQERLITGLPIETVLDSYSEGWDRALFTERICGQVDFETLDSKAWKDMLDWNLLTDKLKIADIKPYLGKYADKWNHIIFINRITGDELLDDGFLTRYAQLVAELNLDETVWSRITCKFSAEELISLVEEYSGDLYQWDYTQIYGKFGFPSREYIEKHTENVHWEEFSISPAANKLFSKTEEGSTQVLWMRIYEDILNNDKYQWDFGKLTKLSNVLKLPKLFTLEKPWDWEYVSEHATWISVENGRDYYFKQFINLLDFDKLSYRTDIDLNEEVIDKYDKKKWNWEALVSNESVMFSFEYIDRNEDKPWDWHRLSHREDLSFEVVNGHREKEWDWLYLSSLEVFVPTVDLLTYICEHNYEIDWDAVSANGKITRKVVDLFKDNINWDVFVESCPNFIKIATVDFLRTYEDAIPWKIFNERAGIDVTTEMVEEFGDRLNWKYVSRSQKIDFTEELVRKYETKWFWVDLMHNLKAKEDIPDFEGIFVSHRNIVTFIERFNGCRDIPPRVYHFTHFYNAIDVIRNRKILSRDRANELGLLKYDSAGSVVFRRGAAHKYARFYFRPCTPTQYYNEALGADSELGYYNYYGDWKSKYPKARDMGLPKCPVPVFFIFDIEEVLVKNPGICYYSDRNMQSDNPNVYQIDKNPDSLGLDYLYKTMEDAYRVAKPERYSHYNREVHVEEMGRVLKYSQQEFLVLSEFDFSEMESLRIVCYDEVYADLLRQIFADDPISKKIVAYDEESVFERENRRLMLSRTDEDCHLSTDFKDEYYFSITGERLSDVAFDLSNCEIIFDRKNELRVKGEIEWKKTDIPFDVTFVDPQARTKEWLVYHNI